MATYKIPDFDKHKEVLNMLYDLRCYLTRMAEKNEEREMYIELRQKTINLISGMEYCVDYMMKKWIRRFIEKIDDDFFTLK